jgi:chromate reductase, NAD(P)H dehydrogenase (quinone)
MSAKICHYYEKILSGMGEECQFIDLNLLPVDFIFSCLYENAGKNPDFFSFQEKVTASNKFIFIVPEYNGSFPGVLKAFIDGLKFPDSFKGKKAAIVGLSAGNQGAALAMSHLVDILNFLGMHVLAKRPRLTNMENSFSEGEFQNKYYSKMLNEQAKELISF